MKTVSSYLLFPALLLFASNSALGWGERGHNLVTLVAVEHLYQTTEQIDELNRPFRQRSHMLSHLSNVPDIVWRADYMSESERTLNSPTHYIDIDYVYPNPVLLADVELAFENAKEDSAENGYDLVSQVGTAPWRVLQLYREMTKNLRSAKATGDRSEFTYHVDQALLNAGLMSHFVGDLANPHHTTKDHDGWMTGNGGLHAYFETRVLAELPITLMAEVAELSSESLLEQRLTLKYNEEQRAQILGTPDKLIFALTLDSFQRLDRLVELDDEHSLLKRSQTREQNSSGLRIRAERKAPAQVAPAYESFAVERLAMGASVLAQLWLLAWQEAGEPDLSGYQSYWYPVQPDFIQPDYIQ